MSKETSYYPALRDYLVQQLESNFYSRGKAFRVYGCIGELKTQLSVLIQEEALEDQTLIDFQRTVLPLNLDIFLIVLNSTGKFRLVICEVKKKASLGLMELSQLIGYTLIANCEFGLLINIDNVCSTRFQDILTQEPGTTHIYRSLNPIPSGRLLRHHLGVMAWNSVTKRMFYTNTGAIRTIPHLTDQIIESLEV